MTKDTMEIWFFSSHCFSGAIGFHFREKFYIQGFENTEGGFSKIWRVRGAKVDA